MPGLTRAQVQAALDRIKLPDEVIRKSRGVTTADDKDKPPFSIAKYFRGGIHGNWADADYEKERFVEVNKQLQSSVGTAGGFLVTPEYSTEIIELMRAKAVVRGLGPRVYPMSGNTMFFNRQTGAAQAFWVAEGAGKTLSQETFGQESLVLKEVAGVVPISNDLLEDASPSVDALVRNDLVSVLTLAEDLAFIQGTGGTQPLGIYNDPLVPGIILGGGNAAIPTFDDLLDAMLAVEAANGTYNGWLMHPRTKNTLRKLKDGIGNYIYNVGDLSKGEQDTLLGLPVAKSTQIPINLTFGTSAPVCSYLILGQWDEFAIGEKAGAGIKIDVDTSIYFLTDETAIRAVRRVDCLVRRPAMFYIMRGLLP